MFTAKVIEDSISEDGVRLITMQLTYPRFIHAEFMTHRVFSRNASSSRAIPVQKMIDMVRTNPAMPIHWGQNQPGMQAGQEIQHVGAARDQWLWAAMKAADVAGEMTKIGLHKQVANRILEPFQWITVIVSATEWENFFTLRDHPDAQPEIRHLAWLMKCAQELSFPVGRRRLREEQEGWHLPYITRDERDNLELATLIKCSVARCARVSYLTHDGQTPSIEADMKLYDRLVGSKPIHASPTEHQAYPMPMPEEWCKNFRGWRQHRESVEFYMAA